METVIIFYYYLLIPPHFLSACSLSLSPLSFNNYNNQLTMITEIISCKIAKQTTLSVLNCAHLQ